MVGPRPAGSIPAAFGLSFHFSFVAPRKDGAGARYRPGYMARSSNGIGRIASMRTPVRVRPAPTQHDERRWRAWRLQLSSTIRMSRWPLPFR